MRLVEAGIDALVFTKRTTDADYDKFFRIFSKELEQAMDAKNTPRSMSPNGYAGTQCGHVFLGERPDGGKFEIKGNRCNLIAQEIISSGIVAHCTRIDSQVTIERDGDPLTVAQRARRRFNQDGRKSTRTRQAQAVLYETPGEGDSYYINTGDKSRMFRRYHKGLREPGLYNQSAWRDELQHRNARAPRAWELYRQHGDIAAVSRGMVQSFLTECGMIEAWFTHNETVPLPSACVKSTFEGRLAYWYSTCLVVASKLEAGGISRTELIDSIRNMPESGGENCKVTSLKISPAIENKRRKRR